MKTICYLILALILAVLVLAVTGCGSTFYGPDGKPTARINGDYTYQRTSEGDVSISLRHSETILAHGNAVSKGIGAAGSSLTALAIAAP
jgi:hypothetical protein